MEQLNKKKRIYLQNKMDLRRVKTHQKYKKCKRLYQFNIASQKLKIEFLNIMLNSS
jgi:hypothetical protein